MIRSLLVVLALYGGSALAEDYQDSKCVDPAGWQQLEELVEKFRGQPGESDVLYLRDLRVFMCTQIRLNRVTSSKADLVFQHEKQRVIDEWTAENRSSGDL
jgi:hypothetical protein